MKFPEGFPSLHPTQLPFDAATRPMLAAAHQWLQCHPQEAAEIASGPQPSELTINLLSAILEALDREGLPGAPAVSWYTTRLHLPALAHHRWDDYLDQLRSVIRHHGATGDTIHVCSCMAKLAPETQR